MVVRWKCPLISLGATPIDQLRFGISGECNMQSDSVLKGLAYGGFASCVAETSAPPSHATPLG